MRGIQWLLLFLPAAILAELAHIGGALVFAASALAIVPLAGTLGEATEALALRTGPHIGGLMNATFGNAAELIITLVAIQAGQMELVRASMAGIALDGESNWLEGAMLLAVYGILGLEFFLPAGM